jgi:hypothetical protein
MHFFRIINLSIRQANAGYQLNSDKANCLTKYDFPFPRYQKLLSISLSMIFLFQDIRNEFLFRVLFRRVWFSFSKISKTTFYFTKYDFPFPRYQKQISISRSISRSVIFLFQDIKKLLSISLSIIFLFQDIRNKFLFRVLFRGVWFSFSKISKTTFYFAKYGFPFPRYQKLLSISLSMIFLFQDIRNYFRFRVVWFSFSKILETSRAILSYRHTRLVPRAAKF